MERIPISSSSLLLVAYDVKTGTLVVEFRTHRVYEYSNVPESIYKGLMWVESHGRFFEGLIRNGGFARRRIM